MRLHDISTHNLSGFSDREAVAAVVNEFREMAQGINRAEEKPDYDAAWDALRARVGDGL